MLPAPSAKGEVSQKVAAIPFPGGMLEFNLTVPSGKLDDYYFAFANLLTSFRINHSPAAPGQMQK
jgi:hypothetical protein